MNQARFDELYGLEELPMPLRQKVQQRCTDLYKETFRCPELLYSVLPFTKSLQEYRKVCCVNIISSSRQS